MSEKQEWKRLQLHEYRTCDPRFTMCETEQCSGQWDFQNKNGEEREQIETQDWNGEEDKQTDLQNEAGRENHASSYLIARDEQQEERRKELLYRVLGPVFFGKKEAESWQELRELFRRRYGIDVDQDFFEGDEHYEEYLEAQQAIAEGMAIYSGSISFDEETLAEYAEQLWEDLEQMDQKRFRRINTMLEE